MENEEKKETPVKKKAPVKKGSTSNARGTKPANKNTKQKVKFTKKEKIQLTIILLVIVLAIVGIVLIFFVIVVLVPCIQVYMGNFLFSAYGV